VSCEVRPIGTLGAAGVIVIELSVAPLTVTTAVAVVDPTVAVTVVAPALLPWSRPVESTVAIAEEPVVQVTEPLMLAELPSL
jgi:hypothetical protein